jgi:hypothetical protein
MDGMLLQCLFHAPDRPRREIFCTILQGRLDVPPGVGSRKRSGFTGRFGMTRKPALLCDRGFGLQCRVHRNEKHGSSFSACLRTLTVAGLLVGRHPVRSRRTTR